MWFMASFKSGFSILIAMVVGLFVLITATSLLTVDFLVDMWWFDSLGFAFYFWQRLLYRYVVFGSVTLLFFLIFFLNFLVASRYLGTTESSEPQDQEKRRAYKEILGLFRTGSMRVYTPLSLVLGILVAYPLFEQWEAFLLYVFGPSMGVTDPVYGNDISYYLFSFPIYSLLQRRILIAFTALLAGILFLYWLERRILYQHDQKMPPGARLHINCLIGIIFLIEMWNFNLQRYELLYTGFHEPLFSGPGFAEMNIILPLIWACLLLLAGLGISLIVYLNSQKGIKPLIAFAVLLVLALGGRYSKLLPDLVNEYIVKPNAISRQSTYIRHNIESTLAAFRLKDVEIREVAPERLPVELDTLKTEGVFRNIPIWDGELLNDVFKHLQELRTYYDFAPVDVSHYAVRGHNQQVYLAARELNTSELPPGARNWINERLTYTHGYGVVMVPAGQGGDEPLTWFIKGIPLESDFGFQVEQPGIYHGLLDNYPPVIAPNDAGEFGYPKGESNVTVNYSGDSGVPISSLFRKLMFAYYFKDKDIFFTVKTNESSKLLFRRNIRERIRTLTPYLLLDQDPYVVVTSKRLFWIQDAYTHSSFYPYAASYPMGDRKVNYIRNSIKIVVDAYDGRVSYYAFDRQDPMVQAFDRMYPGLIKDQSEMPPELRSQVRYPQDIFNVQMEVYAKYQQTDPAVFYQQEDAWEFAATSAFRSQEAPPMKSYYLTLDLFEQGRFDFVLLSPMTPKGKSNLRALAVAGAEPRNYGRIIVYSFPKGQLVFGPEQIYSLINQDTQVSQQITLWDQVGSQVERGKMIILPVGRVIIYIQPVYLKSSTALKIPELKRVIMTQGQFVVMETTLEEAYTKLVERSKDELRRIERRFAPIVVEPQPQTPRAQQQPPPPQVLPQPYTEAPLEANPQAQPQPKPESEAKPEASPKVQPEVERVTRPPVEPPGKSAEQAPSTPQAGDHPETSAESPSPPVSQGIGPQNQPQTEGSGAIPAADSPKN
jgi:uncharacterized membrane protein (UPF0182 family)